MFNVNGNPILESDMDVLLTLKSHLALNGIYLFETFKDGPRNIQFNCPVHGDGQERKPSCGISRIAQKAGPNKTTPAGTVHCFTCGYTSTLEEMISLCFGKGKEDKGSYGKQWLVKNFLTVAIENRQPLALDFDRHVTKVKSEYNYITDEELASYRFYDDYMYKRKLTDELIDMYDVGYDKNFVLIDKDGKAHPPMECVTFPVRDLQGRTLFVARRAIHLKLFHYPMDVEKPVYGLYELSQMGALDEVVVVESVFNAITSVKYGKASVALLGLGTEGQYQQLLKIPCRKFVCGFDPDAAGDKAAKRLKDFMKGRRLVTQLLVPPDLDINDLEEDEFLNLPEIF